MRKSTSFPDWVTLVTGERSSERASKRCEFKGQSMRHETDKLFAPGTAAGISRRRDLWLSSRGFKIVGMLIYHSQ